MKLKELIENLKPELKGIAFKLSGKYPRFDMQDLIQEMYLYLGDNFKPENIKRYTKSYLLQGCWFHLKNYIRTSSRKLPHLSLDEPVGDGQINRIDKLGYIEEIYEKIEFKMAVSEVMNNGLSKREKEVFSLILEGYTLREIGEKLNLSHVMVFKIKKTVTDKTYGHFFEGSG